MTLEEQQAANLRNTIADFAGYLVEVKSDRASIDRMQYIYRQAVTCSDLLDNCWVTDRTIHGLVTDVFVELYKRGISRSH